jgi:hypothetical protein
MRNAQTKVDRRPQRNIHRGRQRQDHISARRRPTGFDEAYMPLRRAHGNRQVQLRMAAPFTPFLQ